MPETKKVYSNTFRLPQEYLSQSDDVVYADFSDTAKSCSECCDLYSVNTHIEFESHDLTQRVFGKILFTHLENGNLLIGDCRLVVLI